MKTVRFELDPNNLPRHTAAQNARLDAMTDEEITAAALSDSDNPPLTDEEIERFTAQRLLKDLRQALGMTQEQFAASFHISYGRLRDIEQGRTTQVDGALIAYLRVIANDPERVARLLAAA